MRNKILALGLAAGLGVFGSIGSTIVTASDAEALSGICGQYSTFSATNSSCDYRIMSFSTAGKSTVYGNAAGKGKKSTQMTCMAGITSYGVPHRV